MDLKVALDTVWVVVSGMLVSFMNLGFGLVESGFTRAKNTVNIVSKNFIVFAVSTIVFLFVGWGLMYGDGNTFMGLKGLFFVSGADNSPAVGDTYEGAYSALSWTGVPLMAKFFFQLVFAGVAATIVSGAVAERIKYSSFIVFSFFLVAFIYPIVGHWIWGGGWLAELGSWDFAASAGALAATALAWMVLGKPNIGMTINGTLGGLVGITAGAAFVSVSSSFVIGAVAGALIVFGILLLDKLRLDDPVGAIAVHGIGGIFGTLAVGLFAQDIIAPGTTGNGLFFGGGFALLWNQLIGVAAVGAAVFSVSLAVWLAIKATLGVRVSEEEEIEGLDRGYYQATYA